MSVMVTALSEKSFVVTEPGLGPNREVGVFLTVYRIVGSANLKEGEKIREVSRVFHRSANGGRALSSQVGRPGGGSRGANTSRRGGTAPPSPGAPTVNPVSPFGQPSPGPTPPNDFDAAPANPSNPPRSPEDATPPSDPRAKNNLADPTSGHRPGGDVLGVGNKSNDDPFDDI